MSENPYQSPETEETGSLAPKSLSNISIFHVSMHGMLFLISAAFIFYVLPEFKDLFEEFEIKLPRPTEFLFSTLKLWGGWMLLMVVGFFHGAALISYIYVASKGIPVSRRISWVWAVIFLLFHAFLFLSIFMPLLSIISGLTANKK